MIKFFRKIRQQLIKENNMRKYLTYAIGEIILVVIGILIALQINNWNEKNKQVKVEQTFLKRLKIDLQENVKNWNDLIEFQNFRNKGVKAFVKFRLKEKKDSFQKLFPYFNSILRWDEMTMNQVTFQEMQSSGKLDLIQSDSIKIKLLELDKLYQIVFKRHANEKIGHDKFLSNAIDKLDFLKYLKIDPGFKELHPKVYSGKEVQTTFEKVLEDNMALLYDQQFMNSLVGSLYNHSLVVGGMEDARDKAEELLVLIEKEIN